jgi:hypothetical protein
MTPTHHRAPLLTWAVLLLALASIARPAAAQTFAAEGPSESPQRFSFEARFGPYSPDIDASLPDVRGGQGPYAATFGSESRFYTEFEFDWQAFRFYVGSFGVGGAAGIFSATAKALAEDSSQRSEDDTSLWVLPLTLLVNLRFDYFAERWNVPLVPFFKFGLTYALWWATDADGVAEAGGEQGSGGTAGLRIGGGLMLRLDWIEPRVARTFDNEFGVNHSYLFFEWYWAWLDGFGAEDRMNLTDSTWALGVALEF